VQEWIDEPQYMTEDQLGKRMYMISLNEVKFREIISKASQYGADRELEACCETLDMVNGSEYWSQVLRSGRRPKPPSLKEQALEALQFVDEKLDLPLHNHCNAIHTIRAALEALPND
jgi:hypothetical protein